LELVGLWVHSEEKEGRDAGELCGAADCGVRATRDAEALLAMEADCVVYTATADLRPLEAVDDICKMLRSGKNVVSSSVVSLVHPSHLGPEIEKRIEEACAIGGTSFLTSGIDPGFANDTLPLTLSSMCQQWTQIRIREVVNYATYNQPEVVLGTMGFGKEMDDIAQSFETLPAPRDLDTPMGVIREGTRAALRFEVCGVVDGQPRIVVEHVTRMHDDLAPDWPGGEYNPRVPVFNRGSSVFCPRAQSRLHSDVP